MNSSEEDTNNAEQQKTTRSSESNDQQSLESQTHSDTIVEKFPQNSISNKDNQTYQQSTTGNAQPTSDSVPQLNNSILPDKSDSSDDSSTVNSSSDWFRFRVRLYSLSEEGNWDEKGNGYCDSRFHDWNENQKLIPNTTTPSKDEQRHDSFSIYIRSTPTDEFPPLNPVSTIDMLTASEFQRQGGSILTWCIPVTTSNDNSIFADSHSSATEDFAMSFQDEKTCEEIWKQIQQFESKKDNHEQRKMMLILGYP